MKKICWKKFKWQKILVMNKIIIRKSGKKPDEENSSEEN